MKLSAESFVWAVRLMAHVQENQVGKLGFHTQMNRHLLWMRVSDYQGIRGVEFLPRKQASLRIAPMIIVLDY